MTWRTRYPESSGLHRGVEVNLLEPEVDKLGKLVLCGLSAQVSGFQISETFKYSPHVGGKRHHEPKLLRVDLPLNMPPKCLVYYETNTHILLLGKLFQLGEDVSLEPYGSRLSRDACGFSLLYFEL